MTLNVFEKVPGLRRRPVLPPGKAMQAIKLFQGITGIIDSDSNAVVDGMLYISFGAPSEFEEVLVNIR